MKSHLTGKRFNDAMRQKLIDAGEKPSVEIDLGDVALGSALNYTPSNSGYRVSSKLGHD